MPVSITRRELLSCGTVLGTSLLICRHSRGQSTEARPETHTYKTVGDLAIKADVYRHQDRETKSLSQNRPPRGGQAHFAPKTPQNEPVPDGSGIGSKPVVVWIHGGALIGGHRGEVPGRVKKHTLDAGYTLISLDYRLAPETKLPEIIKDLEDAFRWIRRDGPRLFGIDATRIAVIGGSAGGYLTLTAGFRVNPRPTVLLSLWGYGDLIGDWYSKPSPHPRHQQSKMTREEAYRQVSGPAISDSRDRKGDGGAFYQYCRQTGSWPQAVSGWDPIKEPERFYPFMPVKNVTAEYPPTAMIHGTNDTDVPYEQSAMMDDQFKHHDVPHIFIGIPGGEHGLGGGDPKQIDAAYAKAFAFVDKHLTSR